MCIEVYRRGSIFGMHIIFMLPEDEGSLAAKSLAAQRHYAFFEALEQRRLLI